MRYEFKLTEYMRPYCYMLTRCANGRVQRVAKRCGKLVTNKVGNTKFGFVSNKCW